MHKLIIGSLLFAITLAGCRKNEDLSFTAAEAESRLEFSFDDSATAVESISPEENSCTEYLFGGTAGYYFGCTSSFRLKGDKTLGITLGTAHSSRAEVDNSDFETLIATGDRSYGSLGAFSSFPDIHPDRVEISFTDQHNKRWSSTHIQEKPEPWGVQADVTISQPGSFFRIDQSTRISQHKGKYRISGDFRCTMYEVNGTGRKALAGKFKGIIERQ